MSDAPDVDFPIAMLGPRGVGKTSMIAAFVNEFDKVFEGPLEILYPEEQTRVNMAGLLLDLKKVAEGKPAGVDTGSVGIGVTSDIQSHRLEIRHVTSGTGMFLNFTDYPGNWLQERNAEVSGLVGHAAVILIAVDTPALMELDETDHEEVNMPNLLTSTLKSVLAGAPGRERLVVFVPMKCERWVQAGGHAAVWARLSGRYASLLKALRKYPEVAVAAHPVQTLGAVRFSHYELQKGRRKALFTRSADGYSPKDCEKPLLYCLAFVLKQLHERFKAHAASVEKIIKERHWLDVAWDGFQSSIGFPTQLQKALSKWQNHEASVFSTLEHYVKTPPDTPPFGVVQGRHLLGL